MFRQQQIVRLEIEEAPLNKKSQNHSSHSSLLISYHPYLSCSVLNSYTAKLSILTEKRSINWPKRVDVMESNHEKYPITIQVNLSALIFDYVLKLTLTLVLESCIQKKCFAQF